TCMHRHNESANRRMNEPRVATIILASTTGAERNSPGKESAFDLERRFTEAATCGRVDIPIELVATREFGRGSLWATRPYTAGQCQRVRQRGKFARRDDDGF